MKKAILTLVVLALACFVQAQQIKESKVPVKIKNAFTSKNPDASIVRWEKQKNNYKVVYSIENSESSALYDPAGKMIEQEFTVSSNDLSSNIIEYLSNVEPKEPLSTIAIVKDASGSKSYKVLVHGMYYYFDAKEAFVKKLKQ